MAKNASNPPGFCWGFSPAATAGYAFPPARTAATLASLTHGVAISHLVAENGGRGSAQLPEPRKQTLGGAPPGTDEQTLQQIFAEHGEVEEVFVMRGGSRSGQACAFVRLDDRGRRRRSSSRRYTANTSCRAAPTRSSFATPTHQEAVPSGAGRRRPRLQRRLRPPGYGQGGGFNNMGPGWGYGGGGGYGGPMGGGPYPGFMGANMGMGGGFPGGNLPGQQHDGGWASEPWAWLVRSLAYLLAHTTQHLAHARLLSLFRDEYSLHTLSLLSAFLSLSPTTTTGMGAMGGMNNMAGLDGVGMAGGLGGGLGGAGFGVAGLGAADRLAPASAAAASGGPMAGLGAAGLGAAGLGAAGLGGGLGGGLAGAGGVGAGGLNPMAGLMNANAAALGGVGGAGGMLGGGGAAGAGGLGAAAGGLGAVTAQLGACGLGGAGDAASAQLALAGNAQQQQQAPNSLLGGAAANNGANGTGQAPPQPPQTSQPQAQQQPNMIAAVADATPQQQAQPQQAQQAQPQAQPQPQAGGGGRRRGRRQRDPRRGPARLGRVQCARRPDLLLQRDDGRLVVEKARRRGAAGRRELREDHARVERYRERRTRTS